MEDSQKDFGTLETVVMKKPTTLTSKEIREKIIQGALYPEFNPKRTAYVEIYDLEISAEGILPKGTLMIGDTLIYDRQDAQPFGKIVRIVLGALNETDHLLFICDSYSKYLTRQGGEFEKREKIVKLPFTMALTFFMYAPEQMKEMILRNPKNFLGLVLAEEGSVREFRDAISEIIQVASETTGN